MNYSDSAYYSEEHRLYHNTGMAMGTRFDMVLPGMLEDQGNRIFKEVIEKLISLEKLLSRFDPESPVSAINQLAARRPVKVEKELFKILILCRHYHELTNGLFDIGLGKISLSDFRTSEILKDTGIKNIAFNEDSREVRFRTGMVEIDLGGFGKGYALREIGSVLEENKVRNAFISFGDSSVLALGNHPHGKGWRSGIYNMHNREESLYEFELENQSLSTSGTKADGIIHPLVGPVEKDNSQISVVSDSPLDAEILSTCLIASTGEEQYNLLSHFPRCRAIEIRFIEAGQPVIYDLNTLCRNKDFHNQ
jgi:thiamine biosynthesis lipoprotein